MVTLDLNCLRCHRLGHDPARGQEDAHHLARILETVGLDGIENRAATDYGKWVKEKGNMFHLRDGVDGHRGTPKLRWEMLLASAGEVIEFGDYWVDVWNDPDAPARVDDYVFDPKHLHQALIALDDPLPDNVWLAGERGTGKTEFVSQVASRLGRKLFRVNFDEAIERAEFIGGNTIKDGSVVWKEGVITQAIQHSGAIVLLDEIGFARAQNLAVLHAVTEHSPHRALVIAETGVRFPVASHVAFFCADNSNGHGDASGNFAGVRDQNTAFIDRFSYTLQFQYLQPTDEVALITKRTNLPVDATEILVKFANVAREKARAGLLTQPPSLRQLFAWARAIQKGVPVAIAFENAIVNKFPADCESELRGVFSATIDTAQLKSYLTK